MGTRNFLWDFGKKCFTFGLIGLTISDRYASIAHVQGLSMYPTFNPNARTFMGSLTGNIVKRKLKQVLPSCVLKLIAMIILFYADDYVLLEKFCLEKYKFSHGDVIAFRSPNNHREKQIKRIIALPGDWITAPHSYDALRIPEGHCWVEGDNSASSLDSRSFGPVPLGLACGRATHIVWPPQRIGEVERRIPHDRISFG